jgi:hypothetical protein
MVRKFLRIAVWYLAVVIVLAAGLLVYLRNADLTIYKGQVESLVSGAIGHELRIDGRFELQFGASTRVVAEDLSLSNRDWPTDTGLVRVGHVTVVVDTWSLVDGPFVVEELLVRGVEGRFERLADRRSNWETAARTQESGENTGFDVELVAFRRVDLRDIEFSYIDPERPKPIDLVIGNLALAPDADDILDLDVQGTINDLPLGADGKLGPWQNFLDGRDITADLDLALGMVRLSIDGSVDNLPNLDGIVADATLKGPYVERILARLGLPPFTAGTFDIGARVSKRNRDHAIRVRGKLGAIEVFAEGTIDRFIATEYTLLDFNVAGPDIRYLAELLGVDGAPAAPFRVDGNVVLDGPEITFDKARASIGSNSVTVNGQLEFKEGFPNLDLSIEAEGPDFSVIGPFVATEGLPAQPFSATGKVRKTGSSWQAKSVEAVVGENRVAANGSLTAGSREDSEISFNAIGPDISILREITGLQGLPARPYDVTASLRSHPQGVSVEQAVGVFGENRLTLHGVVSDEAGLRGTVVSIEAEGPELQNVALLTGTPHLPAGPFDISAEIRIEKDGVRFATPEAHVGELTATSSGRIGTHDHSGEFDIEFLLDGPDVAQFVSIDWLDPFAGEPFLLRGGIGREDADLELEDLTLEIGDHRMTADGALSLSPLSNDSDLKFVVAGPDLNRIGLLFGRDDLLSRPFDASGQFSGTPNGFAIRELRAHVGNDDIVGRLSADLRDVPRIAGSFSSSFLDLTERLKPLLEKSNETGSQAAPRDPMFFSDTPVATDWMDRFELDLEFTIDRLRTNTIDVTEFELGLVVQNGELRVDPLRMRDGTGSLSGSLGLKRGDAGLEFDAALSVDQLRLGLAVADQDGASSLPTIGGRADLYGAGESLHDIMASSNGRISLRMGQGMVREFVGARLFNDLLLQTLRTMNLARRKNAYRKVDCGIYEIDVATLRQVALQTDRLMLVVSGAIDLGTEALNLTFRAKPREGIGVSIGTVANSFLGVKGTLSAPRITIDPKSSATTTGAAVATGGLSLLARGLWDRLSAQKSICEPAPASSN